MPSSDSRSQEAELCQLTLRLSTVGAYGLTSSANLRVCSFKVSPYTGGGRAEAQFNV
ncbi:Hypothetical protein SMAX5B_016213 [Scophthalmus maximus]|uniref:Uncharacterized protein n=1 Tax=Scophthalmus maximus TaxID=52904 RepID=A0A2U9BLE3_SCOMX|nr:Hypothetical protein SMAX5B_016213 [Scophthalmus maximus]